MLSRRNVLAWTVALASQIWITETAGAQGTPAPQQPQPEAPSAQPAQPEQPPSAQPAQPEQPPAAQQAQPAAPESPGGLPATLAPSEGEVVTGVPAGAPASKKEFGEEIVVTGTRVLRKDLTTPAPVTVISREQVQASGKVSIGDFLQALPEQGGAINTSTNNGGDGSTRVNLRGLGDSRTLVLINGRRTVGVGTPNFSETTVDLNSIPTSAVERVEILKDGASAIYGSDAIGGVINIITRKTFDGTEAAGYTGTSTHGDGTVYDLNLTTGAGGDRGHILFNVGFDKAFPIFAGDRPFSKTQLLYDYTSGKVSNNGSSAIPAGRFTVPTVKDPTTGAITGCKPGGTALYQTLCAASVVSGNANWLYDPTAPNSYRQYLGAADTYNFQPLNYNVTPQQRISLFSNGELNLGSSARTYFEATYVNRQSDQQLAPEPLFSFQTTPPGVLSADSIYNPLGIDITDARRRLTEFGPRRFSQDLDTFRVVTGLDGTLPESAGPLRRWYWDLSLNYGRTQGIQSFQGGLRSSKINSAIGPSMIDPSTGKPICVSTPGDATTAIPSCVPLNLLHSGGQAITADQIGGLGYVGTTRTLIQLIAAQFNTSGELFKLLADRPVGLAAGYEFRREYGANIPDPVAAAGDSTDLNFVTTAGGFSVNEGYGELSIPIVNHIPYVENLEGSAAMRVSDYSNFGTTTNYKLGARWSIFPDITLRGTYSTAFRAPSIGELFLGASDNFPFAVDPCAGVDPITGNPKPVDPNSTVGKNCGSAINNGDTSVQLKTRNGGNAALQPETAKIFTAGVVLEPRWVKNLSITLDYWNFAIDGDILNRGAGVILNGCLNGKVPAFCSLIHRDATGLVTSIDDLNTNVGNDRVDGIDLALRYTLPTQVGRFVLVFDGTWLNKFDRILADGEVVHGKGTYDLAVNSGGIGGANPEYRFNTGVAWGFGGLGAGVTMRYIGTYKECADISGANSSSGACYISPTLSHRIDAYNTWDAFLAYNFRTTAGKTSFAVGVHNLFDAAPPVMYNSFTPTADPTVYDFVGRFFYVRAAQNF